MQSIEQLTEEVLDVVPTVSTVTKHLNKRPQTSIHNSMLLPIGC
jgi:hypothetical protein